MLNRSRRAQAGPPHLSPPVGKELKQTILLHRLPEASKRLTNAELQQFLRDVLVCNPAADGCSAVESRNKLDAMKKNQLTKSAKRRVMYIENKDGDLDGASARIGRVEFSKSGLTIHYRGRKLRRSKERGISGNYFDEETGEEYWVSGVKKRGSNTHWAQFVEVAVDEDAKEE